MPESQAAPRQPRGSTRVEGARRLGLALLLGIMLSLAWAPYAEKILLEAMPEAYLANSGYADLFTPEQLDFIAKVWNSDKLYIVYDKYGRAWVVGQGRLPEPLALSTVANAATNKLWTIKWTTISTNNYQASTSVSTWPENPTVSVWSRLDYASGFADDPDPSDGDVWGVDPWRWPAYVIFKSFNQYRYSAIFIIQYGKIVAWGNGVRVEQLTIEARIYVAWQYPSNYHPDRFRWEMCPEFGLPLNNVGQARVEEATWGPPYYLGKIRSEVDPDYVEPLIDVRVGVGASGCIELFVDMQYQSVTKPDGRTVTYNSSWHMNNAPELYLKVVFTVSGVEWGVPGSGQLEYSYEEGSGGGGSSGGGGGQPPEAPGPDQPQEQQQCVVREVNAVAPLIGVAGMVGGVEGTPVDWVVFKNLAAPWPNGTDLRLYERVDWGYAWMGVQPQSCDIRGERGADLSINEYSFSINYGLGPGFWHAETLPVIPDDPQTVPSKNYYFAWYVALEWVKEQDLNNDGRVDPWEVIRYRSVYVYYLGPFPVMNTPEARGNIVVSMIANAFKGALSSFFYFLKSLIPDEIERPLAYVLGFLVDMLKIVVDMVRALYAVPAVIDMLKLAVQLLPLFLLLAFAYDPLKGLELIRKIISLISAIIQAIRAALPLP